MLNGCGDGGGVAKALAAQPAALHDLARDARGAVHLRRNTAISPISSRRRREGQGAPRAAAGPRRLGRREGPPGGLEAMAAAGGAMRTVTARVEAVGIDKGELEAKGTDGARRTQGGGKWTVGGTRAPRPARTI